MWGGEGGLTTSGRVLFMRVLQSDWALSFNSCLPTTPPPQPSILVVKSASGDEEVAVFGRKLSGIILLHGIPHLSHLGVRARQEQVPFALVEDPAAFKELVEPLLGQRVALEAIPDATIIRPAGNEAAAKAVGADSGSTEKSLVGTEAAAPAAPSASPSLSVWKVLPLADAAQRDSGAKAAACGRLHELAQASNGLFAAPGGAVLPYGSMRLALKVTIGLGNEYAGSCELESMTKHQCTQAAGKDKAFDSLQDKLEAALESSTDEVEAICKEIQDLIREATIPKEVRRQFEEACRVIALISCSS